MAESDVTSPANPFIALGQRFVEARASGDLAAVRACLSADLVVQSNTSPWALDREHLIGLTRDRGQRLREVRIEIVRLDALTDGFVLEEVLHGSSHGGTEIAVPSCVIAACDDGQIISLAQYSDGDAATSLLDDRSRVWRLASALARSGDRSHFTAVDVVRSAAALGLLTTTPLGTSTIDMDDFGSGVDERAEEEVVRRKNEGLASITTIPSPPPALPALDLMALALLMTPPVVARGPGAQGVLVDVIAALASNPPFMRQLAEAGIDPRPLADEWVARRDALPAVDSEPTVLGTTELERLAELAGPTPEGWESDRPSELDEESDADREARIATERERWEDLARRVSDGGDREALAVDEIRQELRFEIAHSIRRSGTNGRTVDDAFEEAMQAVIEAARTYTPDDRYGFRTRATSAYMSAIRGNPGGRTRHT